jgi:hypothetical protein
MPDDNRAIVALRNFIAELNAAWEAAGPPSYARLEKLSLDFSSSEQAGGLRLRVLAASTTHEILRGKRRSLPEWAWVVSFINVLRVAAVENGLDPDVVGTIAEWKAKHQVARLRIRTTGPPPAAAPAPYHGGDHNHGHSQRRRTDRPPEPGRDHESGADPSDEEWPPGIGPPAAPATERARPRRSWRRVAQVA